jgi:Cu+-exporting ATPase
LASAAGPFCCGGCATVYAFVNGHGLGAFYACELPPGATQPTTARLTDAFAALDDPAVAAAVLRRRTPALACAVFAVPGLQGASCVWLITRVWGIDPRIVRIDVDLPRRSVEVWFPLDQMTLRQVAELLAAIGYAPDIPRVTPPAGTAPAGRRLWPYLQRAVAGFASGKASPTYGGRFATAPAGLRRG